MMNPTVLSMYAEVVRIERDKELKEYQLLNLAAAQQRVKGRTFSIRKALPSRSILAMIFRLPKMVRGRT